MKKLLLSFSIFIFSSSFLFCKAQSWLWARGGTGSPIVKFAFGPYGSPIGADSLGNVYITDGGSSALAKYDSNGKFIWIKSPKPLPSSLGGYPVSIIVKNTKNIILAGNFQDTLIFGTDSLKQTKSGIPSTYLVSYDSAGNVLWATKATTVGRQWPTVGGACTDKAGNIYITGRYSDTVVFDNDTLKVSGYLCSGCFIVKYNANGKVVWARTTQNASKTANPWAQGYTICADNACNIYITGYAGRDSVVFGKDTLHQDALFIAKYDSAGKLIWVNNGGASKAYLTPNSACMDNKNNLCISGLFQDTVKIGAFTLKNPYLYAYNNLFLAKYDSSGKVLWAEGATHQSLYCESNGNICTDKAGNIYLNGETGRNDCSITNDTFSISTVTMIGKPISGYNFVMKFDPSGNALCYSVMDNVPCMINYDANASADRFGNVYLSGEWGEIFGPDTLKGANVFLSKWSCSNTVAGVMNTSKQETKVDVYPNPSNGKFAIEVKSEKLKTNSLVEVCNVLGKQIFSQTFSIQNLSAGASQAGSTFVIDISGQPAGVYLYRILTSDGSFVASGKLVVE